MVQPIHSSIWREKPPTFSPDLTVSLTGSYEFDLGGDFGYLTPYVQFYYSDGFGTSNLFAIDPAAFQSSYTKTDLRLVWDSPDRNYSIEAFIENIEDEAVLSRSNNNGGDDLLQSSYLNPPKLWIASQSKILVCRRSDSNELDSLQKIRKSSGKRLFQEKGRP